MLCKILMSDSLLGKDFLRQTVQKATAQITEITRTLKIAVYSS